MIRSFSCALTRDLFESRATRKFVNIERVARRKLLQLHAAVNLLDLRVPPGNLLEALIGNRKGQHSIQINSQWRICFIWREDGAYDVEIVDYH
ncbi:type II toxin-antitoxin system RelE/ParE family toxin [Polynucleobacter sp. MWH-Jannik1A5]|uniref:type II toxin-antitoxin system RelE/ParE family toxin n=1 Tax=Polynucleobacter sp. MWH-Jannik1A5 TaxID=1855890 RepID=UPI001C0BAAC5|nr:type II toxin-antitoxin system RelE/ParE family toxin [Polynucleobacter sp. MWH-Jannik1A5]MBU3546759.1 type II toxin-antitoxin system RelE/ParE family toxin [Polynucleobacter sp. MWH-Jannik1A5]